jgi:integrase
MHKIACFFLVECLSGIRFSDWGKFKIETLVKNRNFRVRAQKNKEPIYLPLDKFKRLGRIVDYIAEKELKFDITEQATNRLLKYLGSKIGKPDLTTHVGRHTCGTLLGEMGYSTRAISEVLGISEKTAKRYVKATRQGLKTEFDRFGGL